MQLGRGPAQCGLASSLDKTAATIGTCRRVRKRDVNVVARSQAEVHAWDIFHTLIGIAQLLGVDVLHYLQGRCAGA